MHLPQILIGDFTATLNRQQIVTFPYRYASYFITLFKLDSSPFATLEEANEAGGSVCFKDGTAFSREDYLAISNTLVDCSSFDECYTKLANGECDFVPDIIPDGFVNAATAVPNITVTATFENIFDRTFFSSLPLQSDLPPSHYVRLDGWVHEAREAGVLPDLFQEWFGPFITSEDAKEKMGMIDDDTEKETAPEESDGKMGEIDNGMEPTDLVEDDTSMGSWTGVGTSAGTCVLAASTVLMSLL